MTFLDLLTSAQCSGDTSRHGFGNQTAALGAACRTVFDKERYLHGATINSFGKALWWSITTVTTVGYGDVYPVTNTGRVIAVLLMIGGISLVGVVTAALASWIIDRVTEEESVMQAATVAHVEELRNEIRALGKELQARENSDDHA
jgi:voltage-gated potassium channel